MAGTVFYRERMQLEEGDQTPRFVIVAVQGVDLRFFVKHLRKGELERIAKAAGAELVELKVEDKGHKIDAGD